jgi:A/G-specific adenine glycosylase
VKALAGASLDDVLKVWENLGYYSRARNLHTAARMIVDRFNGKFPRKREELLSLPGIGPYTAGAILSIAFGEPVAAVDGNVRRVIARLSALKESIDRPVIQKKIETLAGDLLPADRAGDFNQALMDLGATVCVPKGPACSRCPVRDLCSAKQNNLQDDLPRTAMRKPIPHRDMAAAIMKRGRRFLLVRRPGDGLLGGLWKFPGGLRDEGESVDACLKRSVREETGFSVRTGKTLGKVDHAYSHFRVTLHAFRCIILNGSTHKPGSAESRWIATADIPDLAFSKADRNLIKLVLAGEYRDKNMV